MEISDNEKRRAVNLIWNAARDYSFEPAFRVFDAQGRAELYWNCIIGAVYRCYDREKLSGLFASFRGLTDQALFENLLWLGLENAAFLRERETRPALPALRTQYARRVIAASRARENDRLADVLEEAHFRRALGEDPVLKPRDRALLDALEFGPELDAGQIAARTRELFAAFLGYSPVERDEEKTPPDRFGLKLPHFGRKGKTVHVDLPAVRGFGFGFGEHAGEYGGEDARPGGLRFAHFSAQTEEGLRKYITSYFGTPLYTPEEEQRMEKDLCTGNHKNCHLHFTCGAYGDGILAGGYAGAQKRAALKQMEKNRDFYHAHLAENRNSIDTLTNRIRNSMLAHLESTTVKSNTGRLAGARVWRGVYLNDSRIFDRELRGDTGNLSVDILLDASTSQVQRQEIVSAQGYIIAESLTRCGLPVRVSSFCSMSGYTIMNLYRDYEETEKNQNIFSYFSTGCNRDGLAVRVVSELLKKKDCEHKILIVLSDCKPNDVMKVETERGRCRDYAETVGVDDTAAEVHQARLGGICVICVFTGNDADLPAAGRIYGREFARIRSLNQFADMVGTLLQNQIRNL